ncbi:MAG: T9SS type A sorting domain-containing protein [Saprospiraceae bacterium]
MRIVTLITALSLFTFLETSSQCDFISSLDIIDAASKTVIANAECTDADGWTHYYNSDENLLLISVKKNGQDIGDLTNGLVITSSTRADYGNIGFNLSNADYIFNEVWLVANRSWQMTGATSITEPIQIRFYVNDTDFNDIVALQQSLGISFANEFDKLNMYTISEGNALNAYETSTQPTSANFTLYDMAPGASPDWMSGSQNGYLFGEYESNSTDIAGSVGILFFVNSPAVAISGNITKPNAVPVPGASVSVLGGNTTFTDVGGNYSLPDLNIDFDYELIPAKNTNHLEDVSATDLIRLSRHLLGIDDLDTPFQYIAADADNDATVTQADLLDIMGLVLGNTAVFPNNTSWRFVPQFYTFPNPNDPFTPPFPETISVVDLPDSLFNQNFTGVKIGDVGEASLNPPPALNTTFILPEVSACNPEEEVVFALSVEEFEGLRGFQFTLEWDKDVMSFVSLDNVNLMGLLPQNIGTSAAADGFLTLVWFNPAQMGTTLMDGEVICELRFLTTGNVNDTTPLSFTSSITDALVVHQNMSEEMPIFIDGNTVIGNNTVIGASAVVEPTDCDGNAIGSIDLTVSGIVSPVAYLWSNGATTEDISSLSANVYTVTITDGSGGCPKVASFEVMPGGQFEVMADVMPMSCPSVLNGSIALEIFGGAAPFTYQWSNGKSTPTISGLYEGMYDVTVTDAVGCSQTASYEIENPNRIFPVVTVMNSSNVGASNGSIMIQEIIGGFPPFTFQWSNGATTQSIMDVPPGNYAVTISDEIGCGHVFGYLLHDLMVAVDEANGLSLKVGVFPNPALANNSFTLAIDSPVSGTAEAVIFSTNGQMVNRSEMILKEGMNQQQLPTPAVSGLYFVQIFYENKPAGWLKMMVR